MSNSCEYAFYIYEETENGETLFALTDLQHYFKTGYPSDWHLSDILVFPEYIDEICEGVFASTKSLSETRKILLSLGFVENEKFGQFIKEHLMRDIM